MAVAPHPSPLFPAAARAGLTFGLVLALIYTARFLSFSVPLLQVIYFVGALAVPFLAYRAARTYRDFYYAGGAFRVGQGFSYVVLLHAFGGILAFVPQYFYFKYAVPSTLEAWGEMLKSSPLVNQADAERMITDLRMISTWQWLWTDYMLTIIMGAVWGLIVGLALRRN